MQTITLNPPRKVLLKFMIVMFAGLFLLLFASSASAATYISPTPTSEAELLNCPFTAGGNQTVISLGNIRGISRVPALSSHIVNDNVSAGVYSVELYTWDSYESLDKSRAFPGSDQDDESIRVSFRRGNNTLARTSKTGDLTDYSDYAYWIGTVNSSLTLSSSADNIYVDFVGDSVGAGCMRLTSLSSACGNSLVEAGEQCDDGNTSNGDGCSSSCQDEAPLPTSANLISRDFNTPTSMDVSVPYDINSIVKNNSKSDISVAFDDDIQYSYDNSNWVVVGVSKHGSLNAGASRVDAETFTPNTAGNVWLKHCVNINGTVTEDSSDNCSTKGPFVVSNPIINPSQVNLVSRSLVLPATIDENVPFNLSSQVYNNSVNDINTSFTDSLSYSYDGSIWTEINTYPHANLPSGSSRVDSSSFTPSTSGDLWLKHCVNINGTVTEDSSDNCVTIGPVVINAAPIDLTPVSISIDNSTLASFDQTTGIFNNINVRYAARNTGGGDIKSSFLNFLGLDLGADGGIDRSITDSIGSIQGNTSSPVQTVTIANNIFVGAHDVIVWVDNTADSASSGSVLETNETNNRIGPIIVPVPDPLLSIVPVDRIVRSGESAELEWSTPALYLTSLDCAVSGPTLDSIPVDPNASSGSDLIVTGPLTSKSVFVFSCNIGRSTFEASVSVNVVPSFEET